jgi:hypothetical protein
MNTGKSLIAGIYMHRVWGDRNQLTHVIRDVLALTEADKTLPGCTVYQFPRFMGMPLGI